MGCWGEKNNLGFGMRIAEFKDKNCRTEGVSHSEGSNLHREKNIPLSVIYSPKTKMFRVRKIYKSCISELSVGVGHDLFTTI